MSFDTSLLRALQPHEFLEGYLADMDKYFEDHAKLGNSPITCWGQDCSRPITSGVELIRYQGANLHPRCFMTTYTSERDNMQQSSREYFDLVLGRVVLRV